MCGRNIEVYLSKPPAESSTDVKERTVFLSHIPTSANEQEIRQLFESKDCQVEEVRLIRDMQSGKAKGLAYIQLKDHRSYKNAINADQLILKGVPTSIAPMRTK